MSSSFFLFFFFHHFDLLLCGSKEELALIHTFDLLLTLISVIPKLNGVFILTLEPLNSSVGVIGVEVTVLAPNIHDLRVPEGVLVYSLVI
jgi:hypothetical protein